MVRVIRFLKPVLQVIVPIVLCVFIGRLILNSWDQCLEAMTTASIPMLIMSQIGFFAGTLTIALIWHQLLRLLGGKITLTGSLKSFYLSILGKYIPGKIWGAAGRVYFVRNEGVPEGTAMVAVLMETLLLIVSASAVGSLAITQWIGDLPWTVRYLPILLIGSVAVIHPRPLHWALNKLSRKFPDRVLSLEHLPDLKQMILITMLYCSIWIWWGMGFFFAINAVAKLTFSRTAIELFVPMVGGNTLAWLGGFVTVISPAGFGVRELILTSLTASSAGAGRAALAAVLARFFTLIGELIGAVVFYLAARKNRDTM